MRLHFHGLAVAAFAFAMNSTAYADGDVNIYSYRQPDLIKPVLDAFTKETGIATNVLFWTRGLSSG